MEAAGIEFSMPMWLGMPVVTFINIQRDLVVRSCDIPDNQYHTVSRHHHGKNSSGEHFFPPPF